MRGAGATIGYVRVAFTERTVEAIPDGAPMARIKATPAGSMGADSPATQIDERVAPQDGDIVVRKVRVGAFGTTDLDQQLRARGVDTLVLAGISTSGVMISTLADAHDRDYRLFVLADATADPDPELHASLIGGFFPKRADGDRGRRPGGAARLSAARGAPRRLRRRACPVRRSRPRRRGRR